MRDWRGPKIIETMLADPNVDLLLCPITGALPSMGNKLCEDLVAAWETSDKPILVVWGSPVGTEEAYTKTLLESTLPTFRTSSRRSSALTGAAPAIRVASASASRSHGESLKRTVAPSI